MGQTKKTDNHNPSGKLALRRHFLEAYHPAGRRQVLDCCQGSGLLWRTLEKDFPLEGYLGLDLKPKKGRLKLDSVRFLDQPGWAQNIIDIDTYGSPWKHWFALLRNCRHSCTVFLTLGLVKVGGGNFDRSLLPIIGLNLLKLELPNSLGVKIASLSIQAALSAPSAHGLRLMEAQEAPPSPHARYFGLRLEKANESIESLGKGLEKDHHPTRDHASKLPISRPGPHASSGKKRSFPPSLTK